MAARLGLLRKRVALLVRPTLHTDLSVRNNPIHGPIEHVLRSLVVLGWVGLHVDLLSAESAAAEVAPVGTSSGFVDGAACQVVVVVPGIAFALASSKHTLSIASI